VPLFIGFVEAGVPLGVTFSFLIAAPMVNEVALALLRSGHLPLVIDARERERYIQTLADYKIDCGPLTPETGVWPCPDLEAPFRELCREAYQATRDLVARARAQQAARARRGPR
jgi:hypothetical protein